MKSALKWFAIAFVILVIIVLVLPNEQEVPNIDTSEPTTSTAPATFTTIPPAATINTTSTTTKPATIPTTISTTIPTTVPTTIPTTPPTTTPPTAATECTSVPTTHAATLPPETMPTSVATVETVPVVTVHIHSYTDVIVPPSCTTDGWTQHVCDCGHSYIDTLTAATGHRWGEWETVKEATTTSAGEESRTCASCNKTEFRYTPKVEKKFELWDPATQEEAEVARLVCDFINKFRAEDGSTQLICLPGMSQVAQYRSRQLVTNLAHDTHDKREALAYYQYGQYLTPTGWDPSDYYFEANTREAIGKTNLQGTAEMVARELTNACRNSESHWRYVGSSKYSYIGIGVAYASGEWYICIVVGSVNYG